MAHRAEDRDLRAFGALIVRKRTAKGLTSRELADKLEVSQSCLSRIENGSREPRLEIMRRLHRVLDLKTNIMNYMETGRF